MKKTGFLLQLFFPVFDRLRGETHGRCCTMILTGCGLGMLPSRRGASDWIGEAHGNTGYGDARCSFCWDFWKKRKILLTFHQVQGL